MFAPQWSAKLEYRYTDLGSFTFNSLTNPPGTRVNVRLNNNNAILAGLNFHFGAPPPPPPPMPAAAPPPPPPKVFIVFFDWDRDTITPDGMAIIQQAAAAYQSGAPVQIQVTGYTDRSGSAGYNQRLSERRANNVAKALAGLGVPPTQMVVSGRGENDNRVPTADGVREPQNRRVEIVAP
jgi:outer membrane protein OmpA-like peptidoglycan-associated protein